MLTCTCNIWLSEHIGLSGEYIIGFARVGRSCAHYWDLQVVLPETLENTSGRNFNDCRVATVSRPWQPLRSGPRQRTPPTRELRTALWNSQGWCGGTQVTLCRGSWQCAQNPTSPLSVAARGSAPRPQKNLRTALWDSQGWCGGSQVTLRRGSWRCAVDCSQWDNKFIKTIWRVGVSS